MAKNCLLIGPYRQSDGWGIACQEYIRALIKTGVNLTLKPIYMGNSICQPPVEFLEYEDNILPHYDIVIQNVLPHLLDYNASFGKNVALIYTESGNWQNAWPSRLSVMDEIWVPSSADVFNIQSSGVHHPQIKKVPIPVDTDKFNKSYESKVLSDMRVSKDTFIFYFIGEFIQRKSIDRLVQAFHIEFDKSEDVDLVIKSGRSGISPEQMAKQMHEYVSKIKSLLRIYASVDQYKKEICVFDKLPSEELYYLHQNANCFVMPSMGESWSMPVMDAVGFGKTPIVVENTGPNDIVGRSNGWVVESFLDNVIVADPPLPDLYTGREIWHNYSVKQLCEVMRQAFEYKKDDKSEAGMKRVYDFTYDKVASIIKEIL
jgi:glycosyltransferase involved in cell wall biosynthesis